MYFFHYFSFRAKLAEQNNRGALRAFLQALKIDGSSEKLQMIAIKLKQKIEQEWDHMSSPNSYFWAPIGWHLYPSAQLKHFDGHTCIVMEYTIVTNIRAI